MLLESILDDLKSHLVNVEDIYHQDLCNGNGCVGLLQRIVSPPPNREWGRLRQLLSIHPSNLKQWNRLFEALGLELATPNKGNRFSDAKIFYDLRH
jgi:hypothetical protein